MGYTKLNIHIYSPTSYAYDFFFLLLIRERLQKISSWGLPLPRSMANISKCVARQGAS